MPCVAIADVEVAAVERGCVAVRVDVGRGDWARRDLVGAVDVEPPCPAYTIGAGVRLAAYAGKDE